MPIHDWARVGPGDFHDFHNSWIAELRKSLNRGLLPHGFYVQSARRYGGFEADVLTLDRGRPGGNGVADPVATSPAPAVARIVETAANPRYAPRQRQLAVRDAGDHHLVAVIEIVSPANKASRRELEAFTTKAVETLAHGVHLVVLDLFPPTRRDPAGMHGAVWAALGGRPYAPPAGEPLTLASYDAGPPPTAHVEPTAAGRVLLDMPLFLTDELRVALPLEATYCEAYGGCPEGVREALEA